MAAGSKASVVMVVVVLVADDGNDGKAGSGDVTIGDRSCGGGGSAVITPVQENLSAR